MGLSNKVSCEAASFSHCHLNPHRCFQSEAMRFYFPILEPWVVQSVLLPSHSFQFTFMQMWGHTVLQLLPHRRFSPSGCPSPPLLPVWINVSSLTPWLSDFHTVRFSGSSGYFFFLNLLLFFLWLCEEAKCVYLYLYLGQLLLF